MALAADLMGLGVSPIIAARTASGGIGPVTITPVGTTFSTAPRIGCNQFFVTAGGAAGFASGLAVGLPAIGGDAGAFIADDYIINNQGTSSLLVIASTSVLISMNGSLSSIQRVQTHTTCTFWPVQSTLASSTANWIGVGGT